MGDDNGGCGGRRAWSSEVRCWLMEIGWEERAVSKALGGLCVAEVGGCLNDLKTLLARRRSRLVRRPSGSNFSRHAGSDQDGGGSDDGVGGKMGGLGGDTAASSVHPSVLGLSGCCWPATAGGLLACFAGQRRRVAWAAPPLQQHLARSWPQVVQPDCPRCRSELPPEPALAKSTCLPRSSRPRIPAPSSVTARALDGGGGRWTTRLDVCKPRPGALAGSVHLLPGMIGLYLPFLV
jgi:hypothetical protein